MDVITTLEILRDDKHFDLVWEFVKNNSKLLKDFIEKKNLDLDIKEISIPRSAQFSGGVKTYFRIFYFYEPVNRIISELKCRFDEGPHEIITNMAEILFDKKVSCETFTSVCEFYSLDLDGLKADHELFQHIKD